MSIKMNDVKMNDDRKQMKKELMRYSKEEIVGAVFDLFDGEYIARSMLARLHEKKSKALLDVENKAIQREKEAWDAYFTWIDSMGTDFKNMSNSELNKTMRLAKEAEKASNERDRLIERAERFFRQGM